MSLQFSYFLNKIVPNGFPTLSEMKAARMMATARISVIQREALTVALEKWSTLEYNLKESIGTAAHIEFCCEIGNLQGISS